MNRHKQVVKLDSAFVKEKLEGFFKEDNVDNDLTTELIKENNHIAQAEFVAKETSTSKSV